MSIEESADATRDHSSVEILAGGNIMHDTPTPDTPTPGTPGTRPDPAGLEFTRHEDFTSLYANNVQFENSVWDFKLIFGELDQSKIPGRVEQHTSMSFSWPMAKLTAYYMVINILAYQFRNGPPPLPPEVLPKRPDPSDPSVESLGKPLIAYLAWVHDQFFSEQRFVPPGVSE